jgi:hypothetical protein
MNPNFQYSRVILKRSGISGATPTINTGSTNHTDGTWSPTDLYEGELFLNSADDLMWVRTSNGLMPISISGGSTTVTSAANIGTGEGIFESNSGGILQFKSLVAGSNITLTTGATEIEISSTGGSGEYTTGATLVGTIAVFDRTDMLSAYTLDLSSLAGAGDGSFTNNGLNTYTGGTSLFQTVNISGGTFQDVTITGETHFDGATGSTLQLNNSGSSVSVYADASSNIINTGVTNSSIVAGSGNTINADLNNVFVAGVDLTATASDTAYFSNVVGAPYDLSMAISDETTAISSGAGKLTLYAPRNFSIEKVKISLSTSGSTTTTVDVNVNGSTILSSPISLTSGNFINTTTSISSADVDEDDRITIDIDAAGTDAAGLKCYLIGKNRV